MNLTVYIPRSLTQALQERAERADLTPARYLQLLLRRDLEASSDRFSERFASLAGSWEDDRKVDEIIADIERHRTDATRPSLA